MPFLGRLESMVALKLDGFKRGGSSRQAVEHGGSFRRFEGVGCLLWAALRL